MWFWPPASRTGIWMTLITNPRHTEGSVAQVSTQSTGGLAQAPHPSAAPTTPTLLLSLLIENTKVLKDGERGWVGLSSP